MATRIPKQRGIRYALTVMRWLLVWVVAALGFLSMGKTCGLDRGEAGEGAPCTRDRDCEEGLACVRGSCAPTDASTPDGGEVDGAEPDAEPLNGS